MALQVNPAVNVGAYIFVTPTKTPDSGNIPYQNALFIGNQTAKFQVNLPKQTIVTATFVRSPRNTFVLGILCLTLSTKTETEVFGVTSHKPL